MQSGYERRKFKRLPIELILEIDKLYKQNYVVINMSNTEIEVFDISKTGLGFFAHDKLPIGYYFNAKIKLGESDYFYAVIKIVRSSAQNEGIIIYGSEFVGLAPFLANKIDDYEKKLQGNLHYYF